jgi:hypothetical protein
MESAGVMHTKLKTLCKNGNASHIPDIFAAASICSYVDVACEGGSDVCPQKMQTACGNAPQLNVRTCGDLRCVLDKIETCAGDQKCMKSVKDIGDAAKGSTLAVPQNENFGKSALALVAASNEVHTLLGRVVGEVCNTV